MLLIIKFISLKSSFVLLIYICFPLLSVMPGEINRVEGSNIIDFFVCIKLTFLSNLFLSHNMKRKMTNFINFR